MNAEDRFQYYYLEYSARLLQIAGRNGIPYDEMEDLLQETFLSFYVHYFGEVSEDGVKPLLFKMMKNRCADFWRKAENRVSDAADSGQLLNGPGEQPAMSGRDTLDIVLENLFFEDFSEAVSGMKDDWKCVYVPHEVLGRSMAEISEKLGISEGACRMRNSRGKRYLAEYLKDR